MQKFALFGLALAALATGCQKKAEGQTIAVVNGEEITASELNSELAGVNAADKIDEKKVTDQALQRLIDRRLLAEQAKQAGIDRSPEYIARQRKANEELLIGMLASRQAGTDKLPTDGEIVAFQAKHPHMFAKREIWTLDQARYEMPKDAAVLASIARAKTLNELIGVVTAAGIPIQRGTNKIVTSAIPSEIYPKLNSLPAGEPFIVPSNGQAVASVIVEREADPLTGSAARTEVVNVLRRANSAQLLQERLRELRKTAKIEYKDGFNPPK